MQEDDYEAYEILSDQLHSGNQATKELFADFVRNGEMSPEEANKHIEELRQLNYAYFRMQTEPIVRRIQSRLKSVGRRSK